jgi:hypothetical protein
VEDGVSVEVVVEAFANESGVVDGRAAKFAQEDEGQRAFGKKSP